MTKPDKSPSLAPPPVMDITEQLDLCRTIIEQSPVVLFRRSPPPDRKLMYVSENISRFGYSAEELLSGEATFADMVHPDDKEDLREQIRENEEQGLTDYTLHYRVLTRDGQVRWIEDTTTTQCDPEGTIACYQGTVADVTERKEAEEKLRKSEEKFRRIIETAAEGFAMIDDDRRIIDVNAAYCRMLGYEREELIGKTPRDLGTEEYRRFYDAHSDQMLSRPYRVFEASYVHKEGRVVPVLVHGNTLTDEAGHVLGHVGFITDLSEQKRSLLLAGEVQKSLLPKSAPDVPGLDVAGRSVPWEEIGGDLYDYVPVDGLAGPGLTVAVGDIAGHGVDSALLMTTARAVLRERLARSGSLAQVLSDVNDTLYVDFYSTSRFMTMFLLTMEPGGRLRWARAGHDPAVLYCPERDTFTELGGKGLPLGVLDTAEYEEETADDLCPGRILAVGTDGIWETRGPSGEMFGRERFRDVLRNNAHESAQGILNAVYDAVRDHTGGLKTQDDITLVVVKAD